MSFSKKNVFERFRQMKTNRWFSVWCAAMVLSLGTMGCGTQSEQDVVRPGVDLNVRIPVPALSTKSDHDLIQGTWIEFTKDSSITERWVFTADAVWSEGSRNGEGYRVTSGMANSRYKLDPSKNPKTIDITVLDGPEQGMTVLGIYTIEGDRLTLCTPFGKAGRPTSFTDKDDMRYVLKRENR